MEQPRSADDPTLATMTSPEAAARGASLLLVPVGSCEQHGPHLPLDTDTRIALALARSAGARRSHAVVAPPVAIGASGEHAGFPGTLSIGTDALAEVLVELTRSAIPPFERLVFVNGHGGNASAIARACRTAVAESRRVDAFHPTLPSGPSSDAHAGHVETSVMLHLAPQLVRLERAEPGDTRPIADIADQLRTGGVASVSPNGILGDPTGATPEFGRSLVAGWTDDLLEVMDRH